MSQTRQEKYTSVNHLRYCIVAAIAPLIFFICGCGTGHRPIYIDPCDVVIASGLSATVAYNEVAYTQSNWPSGFSTPIFRWQEVDPCSDATGRVTYDGSPRREETAPSLWTWAANDSEGTYYYSSHVSFTDDQQHQVQGDSRAGRFLFKVTNRSGYTTSFCNVASGYVRVPYVYGTVNDQNGDACGKGIDDGYRGIDCSGLAWHAGYEGNETVENTNAADLEVDYGKDKPRDSLLLIIPPNTKDGYLDGCMLFVDVEDPDGVDHVGIILNQDATYRSQVIHATAAAEIEIRYEHGRMVMREDLVDRPYWSDEDNYVDIGRESLNQSK